MPFWLQELFCPEHGLMVFIPAILRYWSVWRMGMRLHLMQLGVRFKEAEDEPIWS